MSEATKLTNEIIDYMFKAGAYAWRASSVGVYDQRKSAFRASAKKGVSDILACFKGILVAVEVKIGKDKLSDEQVGFMRNVIYAGGFAFIASDMETFKKGWSSVEHKFGV
jgi:Holliday junction resolvase